ncbi:unnamed protein product [Oppiella nova]|uniref:Glucosylceramidase n=1 Tax=Oppiella nova TaxID=334625 RepID=A0A7R9QCU0_9ACAR|nr:unnamed protein product [Oppiella nova]CAG2163343.1 unnamed protein product [Oppiella nova]
MAELYTPDRGLSSRIPILTDSGTKNLSLIRQQNTIYILMCTVIECRHECVGRKGNDTQYCVCNATYCDDLDPITKQPVGTILSYQSSKSGDRFKESQLKFVKQNDHDNADRVTLTLDKSKRFQKIFGIGAAFTDAAAINIGSLPKDMSDRVIKDYFSASGIGFSMARIPIAGCDFSTHEYTYDDTKDDYSLEHFTMPDEEIKYKLGTVTIPQIKLAKQVAQHGLKLYGSPWNTPHWLNDAQKLKTQPDKQYETWANYFVKFLDEYKKNGIELWGLTMQNEPMSFSSMHFLNASIERDFVKKHLERARLGIWDSGSGYARQIIDNFSHWVSGWVEWNLALSVFGNPNKDKKMADAPLIIDVDNKEYFKNPQFYAIGHFSKFVAPDSVRVELTASKIEKDFKSIAFETPDKSVVVVMVNDSPNPIDITISDPAHDIRLNLMGFDGMSDPIAALFDSQRQRVVPSVEDNDNNPAVGPLKGSAVHIGLGVVFSDANLDGLRD